MRFAALAAGMLLIAACDTNNENHAYLRERPFAGSFTEYLGVIQSSPRRAACEAQYNGVQRAVAQALDARRDLIERYTLEVGIRSASPAPARSRNALGPSVLIEPLALAADATQVVYDEGWDRIRDFYIHLLTSSADNVKSWTLLHSLTQSMVMNDIQRVSGLSMGLDGDSLDHVRTLRTMLDTCVADTNCTAVTMPTDVAGYVRTKNAVYAALARGVEATSNRSLKRQKLREWARQVDTDANFYGFVVNETVAADVATGVLNLPLQAGDFAGAEAALASIIESVWQNAEVRVHVQWVSEQEIPKAYRFVSHAHEGNGRAFVNHELRTINLFAEITSKAIAHEVGHVIGVADHYYTQWNDAACRYNVRIDRDDIMSDHESGFVTASEWREIRENYDF